MLSCGIIGLPMVGKTTLYNLLTRAEAKTSQFFSGKTETNVGIAAVPDHRIDRLAEIYQPKKKVYAQLEVIDVAGLVRGSSQGEGVGNQFIEDVRQADALVHVIRAFNDESIPHVDGSINPMRDLETVNVELLFADLAFVEKRIHRIKDSKKVRSEQQEELAVLEKVYQHLEAEQPFYQIDLSENERVLLQNYTFLTDKPIILVVNVDEEQYQAQDYPGRAELEQYASERNMPVLMLSTQLEAEIAQLDEEERKLFLEELGITQPGITKLARAMYERLGLISFFTVGQDEVRAWTIRKGLTAKQAAGKIHSDLERGFIRAETVAYKDFIEAGSMAEAKARGVWRLEGKDYIVQDGDILTIRFNV